MKTLITVFILAGIMSCSTNVLKYHKNIEIGQTEENFLKYANNDLDLEPKFTPSANGLDAYTVYMSEVDSGYYPEKYLYIFKDGVLVYYNHANRVAMHENEDYRQLAREAYEHFKEED